jgi:glycosyltransferase involved in cell wall biosynthesis
MTDVRVVNICLVHDPVYAGLHRAVDDFARALDAPIVSFDDGRRTLREGADRTPVRRIACGNGWLTRDCHRISARAKREAARAVADADLLVVHSLFRAHAPWAARHAANHGIRYWAVPHGCLDPWGIRRRSIPKRIWMAFQGRRYLESAERVIFSTRREREKASPWLGRARPTILNWPVELPPLADADVARRRFRHQLGVPDTDRLLLYVGRLHSMKRPLEIVLAFSEAAPSNCHLAVVGMDGDLTCADVRRAIPDGFANRIHLVGPLDGHDLSSAYLAADGFISLSFRENFGYAAAEAVAFGIPVILSPGHDLAHEMPARSGRLACGWLLADDSRAAAVEALREFGAATESALGDAGQTGRRWAGDVLSFSRFQHTLHTMANMRSNP